MTYNLEPTLLILASIIITLATIVLTWKDKIKSKKFFAVTILLFSAIPITFYTAAMNMHSELGEWPSSIGTQGFSSGLTAHLTLAQNLFFYSALIALVMPILYVICLYITKLKTYTKHLAYVATGIWVGIATTIPAPDEFWHWSWD